MGKNLLGWLCYLCFFGAAGISVSAQQPDNLLQKIDAIVSPYLQARDFMGVVGVAGKDQPPLILSYGMADVALSVPHKADNIFMIGSVSKQFTAVAVLLLEEDGQLNLSDTLAIHLPDFAHAQNVTIEQLLSHTSGIGDIYSLPRFRKTAGQDKNWQQILKEVGELPLTHVPGSRFLYSNGGYAVLAELVERVSGKSYADFLTERLFEPLDLQATAHHAHGAVVARRVRGYDPYGIADLTEAIAISPAFGKGSGSLWSSARDLIRWNAALHGGKILNEDSYAKLVKNHSSGYGLGLSVFNRFGRKTIGHDGRVAGFASDLAYYPADRVTVAVLSNVQSVARDEIRRLVAAAVFDEAAEQTDRGMLSPVLLDNPAEFAGIYNFGPGFDVYVSTSGQRLLARANEGGTSELVPMEDGNWFSRMLYAQVRFARDSTGMVDRLIWGGGDNAPAGRKIKNGGVR